MLSQGITQQESFLVLGRRPVDSMQMPDEAFKRFGTTPRVSKATEKRLPRLAAKGIDTSAVVH